MPSKKWAKQLKFQIFYLAHPCILLGCAKHPHTRENQHGDADFALVLHPKFWGWGRQIFDRVKYQAFNEMKLDSITILLPPSRPNSRAVTRLGFLEDGELTVSGEMFKRYRLTKLQNF